MSTKASRRRGALLSVLVLAVVSSACSRPTAPGGRSGGDASGSKTSPLSYEMRLGKAVYDRYCLGCHGEMGAGDGFNAFNLDPHPRAFSDPAFQKGKTDAELADAVRRGGAGVGLSPLMPPWGHTLSDPQIEEVVLYVRALGAPAASAASDGKN